MRRSTLLTVLAAGTAGALLATFARPAAFAHCEIPCGIYDDHMRIAMMLEDTTTIEKAMAAMAQSAHAHDPQGMQQGIRWTINKEEHATRIQETIAQYFMTQRIKPVEPGSDGWDDYVKRLTEHHAVMVAAMKAKQQANTRRAADLRAAIEKIAVYYPAEHKH